MLGDWKSFTIFFKTKKKDRRMRSESSDVNVALRKSCVRSDYGQNVALDLIVRTVYWGFDCNQGKVVTSLFDLLLTWHRFYWFMFFGDKNYNRNRNILLFGIFGVWWSVTPMFSCFLSPNRLYLRKNFYNGISQLWLHSNHKYFATRAIEDFSPLL